MNIKVVENFIDLSDNETIVSHLNDSANFGWFFYPNVQTNDEPQSAYVSGFRHLFYKNDIENSAFAFIVLPLLKAIEQNLTQKIVSIIAIHANLIFNLGQAFEGLIHTDGNLHLETDNQRRFTAIYYPEKTDGDTIFYDSENREILRVNPEKNKCVIFESNTKHSGSLPVISNHRKVINLNLLVDISNTEMYP